MISGKVALGGLSLEFGKAESRFDDQAARVQRLAEKQAALLKKERAVIEELARLYLPELSPEAVSRGLRELETRMFEALTEQTRHRVRLGAAIGELPERIEALKAQLEASESDEADVAATLDEARSAVEAFLEDDETYRASVEEHNAVMERRALLKDRRARVQAAANVERPSYEAHAPFRYLSQRRWGEPDYSGGSIARFFDGWLAERTGFSALSRHHRILKTGPHAIQAEIRRLTARGAELEALVDERQSAADDACGLTAALKAEASAQKEVIKDRAALEEASAKRDALAAEAREVEANRGGPYEEAIRQHQDFLESQSVRELLRLARSTPDPRDDELVSKLDGVRAGLESLNEELRAQRKELGRLADSTTNLGDLARSAAAKFSSRRSHFREGFGFGEAMQSILDGNASTDETLQRIQDEHIRKHVLAPSRAGPWDGWFAELSSAFDPELGAANMQIVDDMEMETEVIVQDGDGRVIHRRVTRRGSPKGGPSEGHG